MNIRQLEAFRALILARSTIGAADLLGLSQPAVSRLIAQLEASLELTLFDRTSGRLVPTREAELLYSEVERTFLSVEKIRELAKDIRSANAGTLTVASHPLLAMGFLPEVMRIFSQRHPGTRVSLVVQMSPKVEEYVAAQQVDFGFAEFPFETRGFDRPGVQSEEFCCVPYMLAVPKGHRLARRSVVRPADLADEKFISLTRETVGQVIIDRLFEREGVSPIRELEGHLMINIATFVSRGLGVGLIDPFTVADFADRNIVGVPFEPTLDMRIGWLHPVHRPVSRLASEFAALVRQQRNLVLRRSLRRNK